jgi:hypothetical protein
MEYEKIEYVSQISLTNMSFNDELNNGLIHSKLEFS